MTSVRITPAMATTRPEDVARNVAHAPAATRAPIAIPNGPLPSTACGRSSTAASVSPLMSSFGV